MSMDFTPFFEKYESLVTLVDTMFDKVKKEFPDNVKCKIGCYDCCYALFDLSLIEAIYINHCFNKKVQGNQKSDILERANRVDRRIYKLKRDIHREHLDGMSDVEILGRISMEKIRCPLLNEDNQCDLYENRPITCRVYGIPTSSAGISHTCGISGFKKGGQYLTFNMDTAYKKLYEISQELTESIESKHKKMADMLVPLSMALLTDYDETYLGVAKVE